MILGDKPLILEMVLPHGGTLAFDTAFGGGGIEAAFDEAVPVPFGSAAAIGVVAFFFSSHLYPFSRWPGTGIQFSFPHSLLAGLGARVRPRAIGHASLLKNLV
jgi:hypothetical protein